jgi:DNA mismatch repair protein MSH6
VKESIDWTGNKKSLDKFEKQTRREVCHISTPGTRVADLADRDGFAADESLIGSIYELNGVTGVAFCDTSQGQVFIGEFTDDSFCSNLRTLLAHRRITQLIHQKLDLVSDNLKQILSSLTNDINVERFPEVKFISIDISRKIIREIETEELKMDDLLKLVDYYSVGAKAFGGLLLQLQR